MRRVRREEDVIIESLKSHADSVSMREGIDEVFVIIESLQAMRIAYIPFGVTRPLLDEFCRTPSTKHASERAYAKPLREAVRVKGEKKSEGY